ncbi:OLC1v1013065C1 [Oldenlandia corymbosa var. corymbosa]|uniref:Bidirectional sugar transporter SWEET n=1 Tax=Oldenlandia corymbosa var. corymbosa TaxID=529605 RepID=A0AAV1DZU9_OLDCO|nr:OLC1v1013065C1 [Oldenlandia corymbosa var. corymbosa]
MGNTETARTAVGVIGNVISFGLFLSPVPTFVKIWKQKSVQAFKPDPYVATFLNCLLWVFYGMPFVKPDSLLVLSINAVGLVIESIYIAIFILHSDWPKRRKIFIALSVEVIFYAIIVVISMIALHGNGRINFVGILCLIFNIIMYASPLTVMRRVITTKSVKFMPFYLSLANFANGSIWFSYAFLKFDPWVLIPNGLGALSGAIQLILYATYYRTTNWDEEENPSQVEMSDSGNHV